MHTKTIIVLGASRNRNKYGNKAVRAYISRGWTVFPVNPNANEIEGIKTYKSVNLVPGPIDRVTVYLPPEIGLTVLDDIAVVKAPEVFFNPGADSKEVIERATDLGLNPISSCSIVAIGLSPSQFPGQ